MRQFLLYLFLCFGYFAQAQTQICEAENITFQTNPFRGIISWQISTDNQNWTSLSSTTSTQFEYAFQAPGTFYIRGFIEEEVCDAVFTDIQTFIVNPLPAAPVFITQDTIVNNETLLSILIDPESNMGTASIISGENGELAGDFNPFVTTLFGELGEQYTIVYQAENNCGFRADTVTVSFCSDTLSANGGPDQLRKSGTQAVLLPVLQTAYDQGSWSILDSGTGSFDINTQGETVFNGVSMQSYSLLWTVQNGCGTFYDTVAVSFSSCPTDSITFSIGNQAYTYGLVAGVYNNGQYCWMDRNLGAQRVATAFNDNLSYGFYYQWGRLSDGHQVANSQNVSTQSPSDTPGTNRFITTNTQPYDWRNPQNSTLWQQPNYINNPCPQGWRVPTRLEWENESSTWSPQNRLGAFNSPLKLSAAGLKGQGGGISGTGTSGNYWSNTPATPSSFYRSFGQNTVGTFGELRAVGMPVRCIKQ